MRDVLYSYFSDVSSIAGMQELRTAVTSVVKNIEEYSLGSASLKSQLLNNMMHFISSSILKSIISTGINYNKALSCKLVLSYLDEWYNGDPSMEKGLSPVFEVHYTIWLILGSQYFNF